MIVETLGEGGGEMEAWEELDEWLILMVWSFEKVGLRLLFLFGPLLVIVVMYS